MTLSKLMVLCLSPFTAILGGLDITGFFKKAGLQARHISQTRKSKLRGGRRMQPRVSLTPNPKPQTRPSVKGLLLMDSPGLSPLTPCHPWNLQVAGTVTHQDMSLPPWSKEEADPYSLAAFTSCQSPAASSIKVQRSAKDYYKL